jgi:translation initiation factor 2B subunit (eIF-2B alpha/beta/delta family)
MSPAIDAAILRTLKGIEMTTDCLGTQKEDSFADFTSYVNSTIEDCIRERRDSSDTLAKHFVEYVDGGLQTRESSAAFEIKFITVSASGTVLQCLVRLVWSLVSRNRTVKLSILESRPNFEGASFANALLNALEKSTGAGIVSEKGVELLRMNLRIEIVSDASVAMVVKDADYLLLGADKVLPTGDTNNKIGSLTAAVMATTLNPRCRVVSVFDTDKISGDANDPAHFQAEYNDETEIIRSWPWKIKTDFADKRDQGYKIDVKNAYFEWVPWKYIDCHISEKGVLAVEDIKRLSLERAALERKIFGDL